MMRQLDYQTRVLETLDIWLDYLKQEKDNADKRAKLLAKEGLDDDVDFTARAWKRLEKEKWLPPSRAAVCFSPRSNALQQPVPNALLKIPTGGGKTYLAACGVSKILSRYLGTQRGFVLWVVPNEAIYSQTLRHLKDREHAYRQVLDQASGYRTKIMTRTDPLHKRDVDGHLCVMVLMSQSIKRQSNENNLRFFKERGDVHGFLPPEGDHIAHGKLMKQFPNLTGYQDGFHPLVKGSMGNALILIKPIIILDEAHKEMSKLAFKRLYGFNPSCVLELSATPKDTKQYKPNLLVEVTGRDLDLEGMIKLPLILEPHQESDWQATLKAGLDRLNQLSKKAKLFQAEKSNRYIRPIMLVRVERTGKDQREKDYVHAEDVREELLASGLDEAEIVIKTAEQNDLRNPENQNLLSPKNRVRVIITKSALQEGWDCPFAYVLCSLAPSASQSDMTQLVGRILRQPHATKTGVPELDQCYVISRTKEEKISAPTSSDNIFEMIKAGLESDGLSGEAIRPAYGSDGYDGEYVIFQPERREKFRDKRIYLPEVKYAAAEGLRNIDYDTDILAALDWRGFDPTCIANTIPTDAPASKGTLTQISLTDEDVEQKSVGSVDEDMTFDPVHITQRISDIVLNPFVGREIVEKLMARLDARGIDETRRGQLSSIILMKLCDGLEKARDKMAEKLFREKVSENIIQFKLRTDAQNYELLAKPEPREQVKEVKRLDRKDGTLLEKSLLDLMLEDSMNTPEKHIARYLDSYEAVGWWHRNVARRHYSLQGWQRHKIYPDFIFATVEGDSPQRIVVLESKGRHLIGNDDTAYKEKFLDHMTEIFDWDNTPASGELELVSEDGTVVVCKLVAIDDFETEIHKIVK